jgi:hypothetical protein
MAAKRAQPVKYERVEGFGFIHVIDEQDPMPEPEHYDEAARLEYLYQQACLARKPKGRA